MFLSSLETSSTNRVPPFCPWGLMRKWIIALLISLPTTVLSHEITKTSDPHDNRGYSTLNVLRWGNTCSNTMAPLFMGQGFPPNIAWNYAVASCSCVIDGFREEYTYDQAMALESEIRRAKSYQYATYCNHSSKEGI